MKFWIGAMLAVLVALSPHPLSDRIAALGNLGTKPFHQGQHFVLLRRQLGFIWVLCKRTSCFLKTNTYRSSVLHLLCLLLLVGVSRLGTCLHLFYFQLAAFEVK